MKFFKRKNKITKGDYLKENLPARILVRVRSPGQLGPSTFGSNIPAN